MQKEEEVCSASIICFVNGKDFLQGMKHEHRCFLVISNDVREEVEEHTKVADVLGEFPYILQDNVPNGLPPVRKINHQMYLSRGESFPKKEVHRMKLAKSEELNRQVHELLQNGLIQGSLSPCDVPVLLAPKKIGGCAQILALSTRSKLSIDLHC